MTEIVEKSTIKNPAFWVCLGVSIVLLVAGFLTPPMAKIDGSVLTGTGVLFGFATLEVVLIAIRKGVDARVRHGKTELTVGDIDKKGEKEMRITDEDQPDYE